MTFVTHTQKRDFGAKREIGLLSTMHKISRIVLWHTVDKVTKDLYGVPGM